MNRINEKYPGQPDNEIWFGDKDKPYYELTNFYYNEESRKIEGVVGKSKYPIRCELPLDSTHILEYSINEDGRTNEKKNNFCLFSKEDSGTINWYEFDAYWRKNAPLYYRSEDKGKRILWATAEHLYQTFKFTLWDWEDFSKIGHDAANGLLHRVPGGLGEGVNNTNHYARVIVDMLSKSELVDPPKAREFANSKEKEWLKRSDWDKVKVRFMKWVVRKRFEQHSELKDKLWKTGNKKLVFYSSDNFWGRQESGENKFGEILEEIRQEIIAEKGGEYVPKKETKTSGFTSTSSETAETEESTSEEDIKKKKRFTNKNHQNNNHNQNENEGNQSTNEPNKQPSQPKSSENSEPTQEQLNNAEDKLNQIKESNNEEDIVKILKETSETIKNSGDENLKNKKEETEKKLSKEKLREIIREEIKKELAENGIKPEQLSSPVKQKLDELNNNNNNDQATRTEIFNEIGKTSLNKLINTLEQALKVGNNKQLVRKVKELQTFINSKVDYKQKAYKLQKDKVEGLLNRAKGQQSKGVNQEGFFHYNNPLMWISGIVLISLVAGGIMLVIRIRYRKRKTRIK